MFAYTQYEDSRHNEVFSPEEQKDILNWFNLIQKRCNQIYSDYAESGSEFKKNLFMQDMNYLKGAKQILEILGCYVEYNWVNHRDEWFFVEYPDIEAQCDWVIQCADQGDFK